MGTLRSAALAAVLFACGCAGEAPAPGGVAVPDTDAAGEPAGAPAAVRDGLLRERAARAAQEGRLYSPAGESAVDLYLAARESAPDDATVRAALSELQPYLLIACEDAIMRADFAESRRLLGLMTRSDPEAPALARISASITAAETRAQAEAARLADAEETRLAVAAAQTAVERSAVAEAAPSPGPDASRPSATVKPPAPAGPVAASPMAQPATVPAPSSSTEEIATRIAAVERPPAAPVAVGGLPRLIRQAAPRYPIIAMNRGIEGEVEVAFTIAPDGSVRGARVVRAKPERLFDRAALGAVEAYRFEASGIAHDTTRTLNFRLSGRE